MFNISTVHLWNRTNPKALTLATELEGIKSTFRNKNLKIFVHETVGDCVGQADIIVTATQSRSPLLFANMLKSNAHINGMCAFISVNLKLPFRLNHFFSCWKWCHSSF